jgi:hypothetical protein
VDGQNDAQHDPWEWDWELGSLISEHVHMDERLILAPEPGRFRFRNGCDPMTQGTYIAEGQLVGEVMTPGGTLVPIPAAFRGWVMGYLVREGCPVRRSEPVAWLRSACPASDRAGAPRSVTKNHARKD